MALVLLIAAGACTEPAMPVPTDVPRRDAGIDASGADADGVDAPGLDAPADDVLGADVPMDDVPGADVPPPDVPPFDAGMEDVMLFPDDDAGACATDHCACGVRGEACSGACASPAETCLDDGCGSVCAPRGGECETAADCPSGSTCETSVYGGTCVRPTPGCADARDCPLGHACIAGACADRRIGCLASAKTGLCPIGFYCEVERGEWFCARMARPCVNATACPPGGACGDTDGDGDSECYADNGLCNANAECADGMTCTTDPVNVYAQCGSYGNCVSAADCGAGQACIDVWGDGVRQCAEVGACDGVADCPSGLCGTPPEGGPTECFTTAFPL